MEDWEALTIVGSLCDEMGLEEDEGTGKSKTKKDAMGQDEIFDDGAEDRINEPENENEEEKKDSVVVEEPGFDSETEREKAAPLNSFKKKGGEIKSTGGYKYSFM